MIHSDQTKSDLLKAYEIIAQRIWELDAPFDELKGCGFKPVDLDLDKREQETAALEILRRQVDDLLKARTDATPQYP